MEQRKIIEVDERLPLLPTIPLSLQHLFAMFGSTVLVPFLLHVDPATALFMNGIGTLLYLTICKWRLPAYLGSSFAFISPVLAVCATSGMSYGDAQGGFIVFGLSFMILAAIVDRVGTAWIDILFPPAAMGAVVAIIGLELAPLAMTMAGYLGDAQGMTNGTAILISTFTLAVTVLATVLGRGFIGIIPILIGVVSGYVLSYFLGVVDMATVSATPWLAVPTFYEPKFNISAIMMIMPALFVVFAEHLGHLFVTSDIVGRDLINDPGLHRSLFADGLSNVLSGFVGSTPNTTYGENMGVMAITGVYSTWVIGGAAFSPSFFLCREDCGPDSRDSDAGHGRCLHSSFRLHRRFGDSYAGRKEGGLYAVEKPDSYGSDDDLRFVGGDCRPRTGAAQRNGTGDGCGHAAQSGLPLFRKDTLVERTLGKRR